MPEPAPQAGESHGDRVGKGPASSDRAGRPLRLSCQAAVVVAALAGLAYPWDQPIVEGYVGRQVPTATVARNLGRGSGFFRPQLDTGPFPNLFLVEPPIYAGSVSLLQGLTGLPLGACGRLVSSFGMSLTCWAAMGLILRREGWDRVAAAPLLLAFLPVVQRYGRAFQPDALSIGLVLCGIRAWDAHERVGGTWRLALAWGLTALGLATRVLSAYMLLPLIVDVFRPPRGRKVVLAVSTLAPAACWYAYAAWTIRSMGGSRASADNASFWLGAISASAWGRASTYRILAETVGWRAFGPGAALLALVGLAGQPPGARFWRVWAVAAIASLVLVGGKLHHEYYFLALAPPVAVGILHFPYVVDRVGRRREDGEPRARIGPRCVVGNELSLPGFAGLCGLLLLVPGMIYSIGVAEKTRTTPPAWAAWPRAVEAIRAHVPPGRLVVAPEALLYLADRKGCRLEWEPKARLRAAGEWGATIGPEDPLALLELYREQGASHVVDLWPVGAEPDRRALHDAIRRRYNVRVDRSGVLLAELDAPRNSGPDAPHADGTPPRHDPGLRPVEDAGAQDQRPDGL